MKELYVFCEGATEQGFCKQLLAPHLFPASDGVIHTIKTAFSKHHGSVNRGGLAGYSPFKRDIQNTLKSRHSHKIYFTTLIDLYRIPKDFPGKADQAIRPGDPKAFVNALEQAFFDDVNDQRLIPHIQLHEYETMLFADPAAFRIAFSDCDKAVTELSAIASQFPTIEHIDSGDQTAPSKRIISAIPQYEGRKASAGPDIAEFIGLTVIREKCSHFHEWLLRLEQLSWK